MQLLWRSADDTHGVIGGLQLTPDKLYRLVPDPVVFAFSLPTDCGAVSAVAPMWTASGSRGSVHVPLQLERSSTTPGLATPAGASAAGTATLSLRLSKSAGAPPSDGDSKSGDAAEAISVDPFRTRCRPH